MPTARRAYPVEFRQQIVALVRAGHTAQALSREFGCPAQTIRGWVARETAVAPAAGCERHGLAASEREELQQLRRRVRRLENERALLAQAMTWFAARSQVATAPGRPLAPAAPDGASKGAVVHVLHPAGDPQRR
jgi:transposase